MMPTFYHLDEPVTILGLRVWQAMLVVIGWIFTAAFFGISIAFLVWIPVAILFATYTVAAKHNPTAALSFVLSAFLPRRLGLRYDKDGVVLPLVSAILVPLSLLVSGCVGSLGASRKETPPPPQAISRDEAYIRALEDIRRKLEENRVPGEVLPAPAGPSEIRFYVSPSYVRRRYIVPKESTEAYPVVWSVEPSRRGGGVSE